MKKEEAMHKIAKVVVSVLKLSLRTDANTTTSAMAYQPKAPKELSRFKKN